jgi:hypothetical protein
MFVCFYIPTFNPKTKKNSPPKFQDLPTAELVKRTLHKAIDNSELGHHDFQQYDGSCSLHAEMKK